MVQAARLQLCSRSGCTTTETFTQGGYAVSFTQGSDGSLHGYGSGERSGFNPHSFTFDELDTFASAITIDSGGSYSVDSTYHVPAMPDRTESVVADLSTFTNGEHRLHERDWRADTRGRCL